MTRVAKLYAWILANPRASIPFRDFERLLRAFGFEHVRTTGSHRQYAHPQIAMTLSIQPRGKQAKSYQIEQFVDMINRYQLSMDE